MMTSAFKMMDFTGSRVVADPVANLPYWGAVAVAVLQNRERSISRQHVYTKQREIYQSPACIYKRITPVGCRTRTLGCKIQHFQYKIEHLSCKT